MVSAALDSDSTHTTAKNSLRAGRHPARLPPGHLSIFMFTSAQAWRLADRARDMRASRIGTRTWMLVANTGQCQPLKYLRKHRDTAPIMRARIEDVDTNGPPANQVLFRWLDTHTYRGHRLSEYKSTISCVQSVRLSDGARTDHRPHRRQDDERAAVQRHDQRGEGHDRPLPGRG